MSAIRRRWILPATLALLLGSSREALAQSKRPQPTAGAAAFDLASKYRDLAVFDQAAERYESAARTYFTSARAPEALEDAVVLRMALGQGDKAADDVSLFAKHHGANKAADLAKLALALGLFHEKEGDSAQAKKWFGAWMARIDRAGTLATRVSAHAALGRAASNLGDAKSAEKEYAVVRALWKDPDVAVKEILALGGTEPEQQRTLARALNAVGEALFFVAEQKRSLADAARYPEFKGNPSMARLTDHVKTKLTGWMRTKQPLIEEAERAYLAVLSIAPAPPPRWVIASGFQVGMLWAQYDSDLHALPIANEWKSNALVPGTTITFAELRRAYEDRVGVNDSMKRRAKAAFQTCANYSVKFQHVDAYSEGCRRWLEKNYPKEFVGVDEIIPKLRGASGIAVSAPVAKSEERSLGMSDLEEE
jgi:tetratricopeptide (TPR) repeat protein